MSRQPWLHSARFDLPLIIAPAFLAVAGVWIFQDAFRDAPALPLWVWVGFILIIDVGHVYSTLYRTYFDSNDLQENRTLLTMIPLVGWVVGVILYAISGALFWSALAYVAVFHFIRQQYGFMMLYSRSDVGWTKKFKWIDKVLIYLTMLYPVIYWHVNLPRNFHWFVDGDFVSQVPGVVERIAAIAYIFIFLIYVGKEAFVFVKEKTISLPKQLILIGTALSWYMGIVLFNSDLAFTITNVVSHGIPYIALIWIFGRKTTPGRAIFSLQWLPIFIGVLFLFAYLEEGLWAGFVWREHFEVFKAFESLPKVVDDGTLAWMVPLLALPQLTHYILDGFIWRLRDPKFSSHLGGAQ